MIVVKRIGDSVLRIGLDGSETLERRNAESWKLAALDVIDGSSDIVVDLSGIHFIDSTGVGVLVSLLKAARRSGREARFAGATPAVRSVLQMVKLDRIFALHPDAGSAAAALGRERLPNRLARLDAAR